MRPGQEIYLQDDPGSLVWTGTATNVPVNWPPNDEPHYVRVFDPHLVNTPTGGVTAARLLVGGQTIYFYDQPGTPKESGLIYVDDNGVGRNPLLAVRAGGRGYRPRMSRTCSSSSRIRAPCADDSVELQTLRVADALLGGGVLALAEVGRGLAQVDVGHLQPRRPVVRTPHERLGVLSERALGVGALPGEEVAVADEQRRVLPPAADQLLVGRVDLGPSSGARREPDQVLARLGAGGVGLHGVGVAAQDALGARVGSRRGSEEPPLGRCRSASTRASACGASRSAIASWAPAWSGRAATARSRKLSARSSSPFSGGSDCPGSGVGTGAVAALPAHARPSTYSESASEASPTAAIASS